MSRPTLIDFYRQILPLGGLQANADGLVSFQIDDIVREFTIDSKRLVLPTLENLRDQFKSNTVIFNPLSENIVRLNEDVVMTRYRQALNVRLNWLISVLMDTVITVATSKKLQERADPEHLEFFAKLSGVDVKLYEVIRKINDELIKAGTPKCYINIYVKKGGKVAGKAYTRAAIVTTPFLEELDRDPNSIWGVKLRKKDAELLKTIFTYILPNIDVPEHYNRGSYHQEWPTIDALLLVMTSLASNINDSLTSLSKFQPTLADQLYPVDWADHIGDLSKFKQDLLMVPAQNAAADTSAAPRLQTPAPAAYPAPAAPSARPPQPTSANGTISFQDLMAGVQRNQQFQPQSQPQPWQQVPAHNQMFGPAPSGPVLPPSRDPRNQYWSNPGQYGGGYGYNPVVI